MTVTSRNIFDRIPKNLPDELVEKIAGGGSVTIERIVSRGQASAEDFWYDQERSEYVILLAGAAGLLFEGDESVVVLKPGDYLDIPAHKKHRVAWTSPNEQTVWLAVHY